MTTRENNKYPIYEDTFGRKFLIDDISGDILGGFRVEDSVRISYHKSVLTDTGDLVDRNVRTKLKKTNKYERKNVCEEIK
jgi:hypothetical protein